MKRLGLLLTLLSMCAVAQQPINIIGPGNSYTASVSPDGQQRVWQDPRQLFTEDFSSTPDVAVKWNLTHGGGGSSPTWSADSGLVSITPGTSAGGFSMAQTIFTFRATDPGFLYFNIRVKLESPISSTAYRFWGMGTTLATPTFAIPILDGCGFDIPASQAKMFVVCYQGSGGTTSTRVVIQDLSSATGNNKQPADTLFHKYFTWLRGDLAYFAIDTKDNIVATYTTDLNAPNQMTFPLTIISAQNGATAGTFQVHGLSVGDTGANEARICDPTNSYVCAAVKPAFAASAGVGDPALVVTLSPWSLNRIVGVGGATLDGPASGGAVANGIGILGQFNTALPTFAAGNSGGIQIDAKGQLLVDLNYISGAAISAANPLFSSSTATLSASAIITGQQAVTASAVALPTTTLSRPACVVALAGNSLTVYIGPSGVTTANGFPLSAGASVCGLSVANLNQIFVIASSTGSSVAWNAQ